MAVSVRRALPEDLKDMLGVENRVFPDHGYLEFVSDEFLDPARGTMIVAEEDGKIIGIDHLAYLADGSGWMETLRVDPPYQKHGAGTAIWNMAMDLCEKEGLNAIRMYTGLTNETSKKLGQRNGLDVAIQTKEGNLMKENIPAVEADEFVQITDAKEAEKLMAPYIEGYEGYICFNRTFVPLNSKMIAWLTEKGFVFAKGENVVVIGGRYMRKHALHIGFMGGDEEACMKFAIKKFAESGLPKLTCMVPVSRPDLHELMAKYGMPVPANTIIMLERKF